MPIREMSGMATDVWSWLLRRSVGGTLPLIQGSGDRVAGRRHHGGRSRSDYGSDHHIAGVVHAGMHSRVGHPAGKESDRYGQPRQMPTDGVREGKSRRRVTGRE